MTTVKAGASFDDELLVYVATLRERIIAFGDSIAGSIEIDDIDARLQAVDKALAGAAIGAARAVLDTLVQRLKTAKESSGGGGNSSHVARAMSSQLLDVFAAVSAARADPAPRQAIEDAEAAVQRIEHEHADTLAALEDAVDAADVAAVMKLRPEVEVTLPSQLDTARLAVLDAQHAQHSAAAAASRVLSLKAKSNLDTAETKLRQAREALTAATTEHDTAATLHLLVEQAAGQVTSAVQEIDTERATLAATLEQDRRRRFRRLAGLADPADSTPAVEDGTLTSMLTAPITHERQFVLGAQAKPSSTGPARVRTAL